MLFTDPIYLFLFLPAVLVMSHFLSRWFGQTAALMLIVVFSCLFYGIWGYNYLILLGASIVVNWVFSHSLLHLSDDRTALRSTLLYVGQTFNFSLLILFKYAFFFQSLSMSAATLNAGMIAIPIGISFYTFQQMVFLQEAFRRDANVVAYLGSFDDVRSLVPGFIRYSAFIAFFPQLVIGPIVYLSEFAPQIAKKSFGRLDRNNLEIGALLICVGMFKKIVIADNLALIVDPTFANLSAGHDVSMIEAWTASIGYYAQLYFDFSGYSDIALGSARAFGIILPINFASPLKAVSIADFYKRWHITLTRVIARFFYIPLTVRGARLAVGRLSFESLRRFPIIWIPLLVNFLAIALWHGATTTFLLFGLIHGFWYILEIEVRDTALWRLWKNKTNSSLRDALGRAIFLIPMMLCFSLFRVDSIETWANLISAMFDPDLGGLANTIKNDAIKLFLALASLCFCLFLPNVYELAREYNPGLITFQNKPTMTFFPRLRWQPNLIWGIILASALTATLTYIGRLPPFLYLNF